MDILVFKLMEIFMASVIILSGATYAEGNNTQVNVLYSDEATISCNNSAEVIQIHEIQIQSRKPTCTERTDDDCVISDHILNATKHICDGLNQCQLQRSLITENKTCHESLGYMTLSEACSVNSVMQCNFESNWCSFHRNPTNTFFWKRRTGLRAGYHAFIKKRNTDIGNAAKAKLSYSISRNDNHKCLKFRLYMYNTIHPLFLYDSDALLHRFNISDLKFAGHWNTVIIQLPYNKDINLIFQVNYRIDGATFEGVVAIDNVNILSNECEALYLDLNCVSLVQHSEVKACSDSMRKSISFDPKTEQCQDVYDDINVQFQEQCQPLNNSKICNFDLQSSVDRYPSCFRRYVSIEYSCQGRNDHQELLSSDEKINSSATIVGPVIGLVLLAISVLVTIIVWRRYKTTTNHPVGKQTNENHYTGCQNVALSDNEICQGDVSSKKNNTTEKSVYSIINGESNGYSEAYCNIKNVKDEESHIVASVVKTNDLIHTMREQSANNSENMIPPVDSLSTSNQNESGPYIVLDKNETGFSHGYRITQEGGDYEFAKPLAQSSQYSTGGDQYTVSGSNIHNEPESNLYSHCLDTTYDTAQHCLKTDDLDENYDHFISVKSEDDYDISFR